MVVALDRQVTLIGTAPHARRGDLLHRLATAQGPYGPQSFTYDAHGNRTGAGYTYQSGTFRLLNANGVAMTYDNVGNLKTGPAVSFTYTPTNLLKHATVSGQWMTFTYDADQWRAYKRVGASGLPSFYVRGTNGQLLTDWSNTSATTADVRDHIYAGQRLLVVQKAVKQAK
jgi:hypothetical protein